MKIARILTAFSLSLLSIFAFVGCTKTNLLDAQIYCKSNINYKLNGAKDSESGQLSELIGNTFASKAYSTIQITTDKNWTYGLTLEKIEFDIILSENANVDIDVTISNLENGENYNSSQDTYFYHKTLSISQETTSITLAINDVFINKDAVISLEVVESCYTAHPNLTFSLSNFKMYGEHKNTNY